MEGLVRQHRVPNMRSCSQMRILNDDPSANLGWGNGRGMDRCGGKQGKQAPMAAFSSANTLAS